MGRYDGRTAVITGGSTGFGLTTARMLLDRGARVMITGRTQDRLDAAARRLGAKAIAVRSDAASLTDIDALAARVSAELGTLDLLFVNAGIARFVAVADMTEAVYDEVFAINAKGAFTVQRLAPLIRLGGGIVLTTSVANVKGVPGSSAYAATKAGVRSMTRSFGRELQPLGIRVNAVSPGPIDSGILERALPEAAATAQRQRMTACNPMQRFGTSEEVAEAVLYPGLDATYTTGCELAVDGGTSQR